MAGLYYLCPTVRLTETVITPPGATYNFIRTDYWGEEFHVCEEACLVCEQCDKFKDGCQGQVGTFDKSMCPHKIIEGPALMS